MTHLETAEKEIQLARLLADRVGTRDGETRQQIRNRIEMARAELNLAEDELDRVEELRGEDS